MRWLLRISLSRFSICSTPALVFYFTDHATFSSACLQGDSFCSDHIVLMYCSLFGTWPKTQPIVHFCHLPFYRPNDVVICSLYVGYYITYYSLTVTKRERRRAVVLVVVHCCVWSVFDRLIWLCVDPISSWLLNWVSLLKLPSLSEVWDLWARLFASFQLWLSNGISRSLRCTSVRETVVWCE